MKRPPDAMVEEVESGLPQTDVNMEESAVDTAIARYERTTKFQTSDRVELIESLKRGESPTWVPNRSVSQSPFVRSPHHISTNESAYSMC